MADLCCRGSWRGRRTKQRLAAKPTFSRMLCSSQCNVGIYQQTINKIKKVLGPLYVDERLFIFLLQKCLPSNAFVFRSKGDFNGMRLSFLRCGKANFSRMLCSSQSYLGRYQRTINKVTKKVLGPSYFHTRLLIFPLKNCLPSNAFSFRSEAYFKVIGVSLVFQSWLSHIHCVL